MLGICFGAQALCAALGGRVEAMERKEIGWTLVDSLDHSVIPVGPWLEFHRDRCLLPATATVLARNDAGVQAFRIGRHLAFQFHPEVDGPQLKRWLDAGGDEDAERLGLTRPVPGRHHPRGAGRAGAGGPAGRRRAGPLDNPRQRRTQRAAAESPAVTITAYVIRTRCLAAPAARGSRLDEVRAGPSAHQGGQGQGRHVGARRRQRHSQHLPLGTRRRGPGRALPALLLRCLRDPVQPVRYLAAGGHGRPWPWGGAAACLPWTPIVRSGTARGGASAIRQEVLMAAHEGSEDAERAEQRGIGEATLEQFRADVTNLSVQYLTGETYGLFTEMRRVRNRVLEALGRRQWPRDAAELYLLAGCLSALMAAAATNLGYPQAAEELTRAGWAYATIIDHRPLMARLRLCAAYAAYWSGRPEQSANLARSGLEYLADGENAAQLHLFYGLASARPATRRARARRSRPRRRQGPRPPRRTARDRRRVRLLPGHPVLLRGLRPVRGGSRARRPPNSRLRPGCTRPGRARASSTAAGASCWRTPTWPSRGSGRARSTPRSRPWRPCWPCRRASARRCRASACPWSGPSWPGRSTAVRRRPATSPSRWPGSTRGELQPIKPGRPTTAVIVACMTANGRWPPSANASPRQTTRVRPARTTSPVITNRSPAAGASRLIV